MLSQLYHATAHFVCDFQLVVRSTVLQDMLDHIVSILILVKESQQKTVGTCKIYGR